MDVSVFIIITISVVAIVGGILFVWWFFRHTQETLNLQKERIAKARPAKAVVVAVGKSVNQVRNGTVIIKLRLSINPSTDDTYETTTAWEVELPFVPQVQAGKTVGVKIDAEDSRRIYPNVNGAVFSKTYWEAWVNRKHKSAK